MNTGDIFFDKAGEKKDCRYDMNKSDVHMYDCHDHIMQEQDIGSEQETDKEATGTAGISEDERQALYLLNNMEGMFSDKLLKIYEYFGSYVRAYEADATEYFAAGLFNKAFMKDALEMLKRRETALLKRYEKLSDRDIRLVTMFDDEYPQRLKRIQDRPPLLYVCGRLPDDRRPSAAIIGSRACSEYGRSVARMFAGELAAAGVQIVSGLAYGIDGAAARGSLERAGESYGVLGGGVNLCYPKQNAEMYDRMRQGEGGIISEFPLDAPAIGYHFVMRNRIISGLCDVLIVIEAAKKSGTSITVGFALEQGKEVFALPGRIDDPLGYGCNQLIKDGANIITEAADVLEYLGMNTDEDYSGEQLKPELSKTRHKDLCEQLKLELSDIGSKAAGRCDSIAKRNADTEEFINALLTDEDEKRIYDILSITPQHVEEIAEKAGMDTYEATAVLMSLEMRGIVESPRNAYYMRTLKI